MTTNETQKCTKCDLVKCVTEFRFRKDTNKYHKICKECENLAKVIYYQEHKTECMERSKQRYLNKREIILAKDKKMYQQNKDHILKYQREYKKNNSEKIAARDKEYRKTRKEYLKQKAKKYYETNKLEILTKQKIYNSTRKEQISENNKIWRSKHVSEIRQKRRMQMLIPENRLIHNIRERIRLGIKNGFGKKECSTRELLGCDWDTVKTHLQSLFQEGMTWDNHGVHGWHIDHIRPCSSFDLTDPEQQKECFHYTNLQPLWAEDNLKKSNKW